MYAAAMHAHVKETKQNKIKNILRAKKMINEAGMGKLDGKKEIALQPHLANGSDLKQVIIFLMHHKHGLLYACPLWI